MTTTRPGYSGPARTVCFRRRLPQPCPFLLVSVVEFMLFCWIIANCLQTVDLWFFAIVNLYITVTDVEVLQHVNQELEAENTVLLIDERLKTVVK